MGVLVILGLSSYGRPSELLTPRTCYLIAPLGGAATFWSLLFRPEDVGVKTKTGDFDDSVLMDSK